MAWQPLPLGTPHVCYICRWPSNVQMEVTQFPSDGCRNSGGERVTTVHNLCYHWAQREESTGCLAAHGAVANCPELPFLTWRRRGVTFTRTHSANREQSPRSHRPSDLQYTHKSAIPRRMKWPNHQVKGRRSVVGYNPLPRRTVPSQKASILVTGKLLHCMILLAVLQTEGSSRKCLENVFKM